MQEDTILAAHSSAVITSEEFDSLDTCPECEDELMFSTTEDVRFDTDRASSPPGAVDLDQRCSATVRLKLCFACDFRAMWCQPVVYAGY